MLTEYNRVNAGVANNIMKSEPLVVKDLVKTYRKNAAVFNAVNDLNFAIPKGICFGFVSLFLRLRFFKSLNSRVN